MYEPDDPRQEDSLAVGKGIVFWGPVRGHSMGGYYRWVDLFFL